jgi:glycosyltransferase involved in cell wall biosynthesis
VLHSIKPDVINTHNIDGLSPEVWRVARSVTGAIAHTLHDCHLICPRATMVRRDGTPCESVCRSCKPYARFNLFFQRYVRALIAPSSAIAYLHQQQGWRAPLVRVVRNAVDTRPADLEQKPDGPLHALFLSRLEREKGCETLLRAIKKFNGWPELRFHVAGRGTYEAQFIALAREVPNLEWHGFVSGAGKSDLLSSADVFLQLSECGENAPLGLIEATRFGLFAIGSQCGGIPELIDPPEEGHLIPPGDAARLTASLEDLVVRKAELRSRRPARARKALAYGAREMAEEYVRAFDQLLASEGGRKSEMTNPATSHG